MLEGKKCKKGKPGDIFAGGINPENAALLFEFYYRLNEPPRNSGTKIIRHLDMMGQFILGQCDLAVTSPEAIF